MRVVVATDRSATAEAAVTWAARLAEPQQGELVLLQIAAASDDGTDVEAYVAALRRSLDERAHELAGDRGSAVVEISDDPAGAIVDAAAAQAADVLVVGNAGMQGRKEFLLGNVPNRVSHAARCTVVIVNTAAPGGGESEPATADEDTDDPAMLPRAAHLARVLGRFGLAGAREHSSAARARLMREALEELGPTFAKIGQVLSTRPEALPPEYISELAKLQDDVAPMSTPEVVAVMERELHVPWEDVFASIDPTPLAAGTIGQVHRATLETGDAVVVKVQRPQAHDVLVDLRLLELFAEKAMKRPGVRNAIDVSALVDHLASSLRRELDFRCEADNLERMHELLAPFSRLDVPRVHRELSSERLLVMEAIDGCPLREAPPGEDRVEAAGQLLESYCAQVLLDGFFHADPHPGNLLWRDGTIYFLDLGMVGELDGDLRAKVILLLLAFWRGDAEFLGDVLLMLSDEPRATPVDRDALTAELAEAIARFGGDSIAEMEIGAMLAGIFEVATRHHIRLPPALALSGKAFTQMQLAVAQLAPSLDPFALASRFLVNNARRQVLKQLDPQRLYYTSQKLMLRTTRIVEALERASGARPGTGVQVSVSGTQRLEEAVERAGRRITLVACGGVFVLAAGAWLADRDRDRDRPLRPASAGAALARAHTPRRSSARQGRRARALVRLLRAS
jgi:ubiquinone biosynthesis protein